MSKFYALKVKEVRTETSDCVSVAFDINGHAPQLFDYEPGQYITLRQHINNEDIRRSYSICSCPQDGELRVAIKKVVGGRFSTYANETLLAGETIEVMPPQGHFTRQLKGEKTTYVAFAAGSGITPILSLIKHTLSTEKASDFILFYGNKASDHIIFKEELEGLKNKYLDRFQVFYILSQEIQEAPLFNGRLDAEKVISFSKFFFNPDQVGQYFLCGPEKMIWEVKEALEGLNVVSEKISFELFTSSASHSDHETFVGNLEEKDLANQSQIAVILDGIQIEFPLGYKGQSILDAALKTGADLPFACKGGVCCTCKAKVLEGEVEMEVNYALEPDEVEAGFVLTCQSHPRTPFVKVDYDV